MSRVSAILGILMLVSQASVFASDSIRVALPNPVQSMNPENADSAQQRFLLPLIYHPLFHFDSGNNIRPVIVEKYDLDGPRSVVIQIKKNIVFSDGSPVRAADVVASVNGICRNGPLHLLPLRTVRGCTRNSMPEVVAKGDHQLRFGIRGSLNAFLFEMASAYLHVFKKTPKGVIGSGPFRVVSSTPERCILQRTITDPDATNRLEFVHVLEKELAKNLQSNSVDIALMYSTGSISGDWNDRFRVFDTMKNVSKILVLNPHQLGGVSSSVLHAVANEVSLNREMENCTRGMQMATGVIPEGVGGFVRELTSVPGNSTIAQLRLRHRVKIRVQQSPKGLNACEAKVLAAIFDRYNIGFEVVSEMDYLSLKKKFGTDQVQAYIENYPFYGRDAGRFLYRFSSESPVNVFYIRSNSIDKLLHKALEADELTARYSLYRKVNQEIATYGNVIPLYYHSFAMVWRKCLHSPDQTGFLPTNSNTFVFLSNLASSKCGIWVGGAG